MVIKKWEKMFLKCRKWQFFQRNQIVLLHFMWIYFGLFLCIVTADQSLNNNQTAEIKAKLLKIIQKGKIYLNNIYSHFSFQKKFYLHDLIAKFIQLEIKKKVFLFK